MVRDVEIIENSINWELELKEVIKLDMSICKDSNELINQLKSRIKELLVPRELEYILTECNLSYVIYNEFVSLIHNDYDEIVDRNKKVVLREFTNKKYNKTQYDFAILVIDVIRNCWIEKENEQKITQKMSSMDNGLEPLTTEKYLEIRKFIPNHDKTIETPSKQQVQYQKKEQQAKLLELLNKKDEIEKDIETNKQEEETIAYKIQKRKNFILKEKILTDKQNLILVLKKEEFDLKNTFKTLEQEFKEYEEKYNEHSTKMKELEEKLRSCR